MLITSGSGRVNFILPLAPLNLLHSTIGFLILNGMVLFYNTEVNSSLSQAAFPWHYMSIYYLFTVGLAGFTWCHLHWTGHWCVIWAGQCFWSFLWSCSLNTAISFTW